MFTYRKQILVDNNLRRPLDIALAKDEACAKLNDNKLSFDCFAITRGRGMGQHTIGFSIEIAVPHKGQARFIRRHADFMKANGFVLLDRLYNPVEGNGLDVPRVGETSHCLLDAVLGEMQATNLRA